MRTSSINGATKSIPKLGIGIPESNPDFCGFRQANTEAAQVAVSSEGCTMLRICTMLT